MNEMIKQSIHSEGVIKLFSDKNEEFSLFDPAFLDEIGRMKEKNLAAELLKKAVKPTNFRLSAYKLSSGEKILRAYAAHYELVSQRTALKCGGD